MGKTTDVVDDVDAVFGLSNLNKLKFLLNCQEYKNNPTITVIKEIIKGQDTPTGLHFVNEQSDFTNTFKFMSDLIISAKIKSLTFKVPSWNIDIMPTQAVIDKFKIQSNANSEESIFTVKIKDNNLMFQFGEDNNHNGSLIFHPNINNKMKHEHCWPIKQVVDVLSLQGQKRFKLSDNGALQISVTTDIAEYNYILLAVVK